MKQIEVVAAVIYQNGKYLATQRGSGEFKGDWEFPGGKVEEGETQQEALTREIKEELTIDIAIDSYLGTTESDYPSFHLTMHCYLCHIVQGKVELLEHAAACWISVEALDSLSWLPADEEVIEWLKQREC
ncbi:MAG: (deoxy)nucleoside triphosphate pyrophosphohydrolase [Phocaeicola sp.]